MWHMLSSDFLVYWIYDIFNYSLSSLISSIQYTSSFECAVSCMSDKLTLSSEDISDSAINYNVQISSQS